MVTCSYSCYGVYFNVKVDNHYDNHLMVNLGRVSSVDRVLDFREGGRGFNSFPGARPILRVLK